MSKTDMHETLRALLQAATPLQAVAPQDGTVTLTRTAAAALLAQHDELLQLLTAYKQFADTVLEASSRLAEADPRYLLRNGTEAADEVMCGACGQPWTGQPCGQRANGWPWPTCYPVPRVPHQLARNNHREGEA